MISGKITSSQYQQIIQELSKNKIEFKGDYIVFKADYLKTIITIYQNKRLQYKILLDGLNEETIARNWQIDGIKKERKINDAPQWIEFDNQIGSDEVGVGDLFLPMIVVASYVDKKDIQMLKELGVCDSKKLNDEKIMSIGPKLIKHFDFSKLTLTNQKYNQMIEKGDNLNTLKAKMHNQALNNMILKHPYVTKICIDQFVDPNTYYRYLFDQANIVDRIMFKTKGESYYPSVALSSVIARYALLLEKEKLEKKYNCQFPFGSGKKADEFLLAFKQKYGLTKMRSLVKSNFKNVKDAS